MANSDEIRSAWRDLGRRLANLRKASGYTQHTLAQAVRYGRSSVANTETGHQQPDRSFWASCDAVLQTGGALTQEYDRIVAVRQRRYRASALQANTCSSLDSPPAATASPPPTSDASPPPRHIDMALHQHHPFAESERAVVPRSPDKGHPDDSAPWRQGPMTSWEGAHSINARRLLLKTSNVDPAQLAYLEQEVHRAISYNERLPPAVLAIRVRPLRAYVDQFLAARNHPPQQAQLYTLACYLSGVLAALALDTGAFAIARAYAAEAFDLADAAEQRDVQAWARAAQSLVAYYAGEYHDALAYARDGAQRGGAGPQSVRLAINGEARALARLGDRYGVDKAVDRAFTILADARPTPQISASLDLGPYCPARASANAATAYLTLGYTHGVAKHLTTAINAFDAAALPGPQALSRLDLATALTLGPNPEPERASALALEAFSITADQRYESVNQRAQEFLTAARHLAAQPELRRVRTLFAGRIQPDTQPPPALPFAP